ncbi:MAG: undecaprenyl-phosphate glucose phosphotransferase [Gammaproteobacteria bacterium]
MKVNEFLKEYRFYLILLARFIDISLLFIAGWIGYYIRFETSLLQNVDYTHASLISVVLAFFLFEAHGAYRAWQGKNLIEHFCLIFKAGALVFLILALIGVLSKTNINYSRQWLIYWAAISLTLLILSRIFIYWVMRFVKNRSNWVRRIILIGSAATVKNVIRRLELSPWSEFKGVLWVSVDEDDREKNLPIDHVHGLEHLDKVLAGYKPDELWIVGSLWDMGVFNDVNTRLSNSVIDIRLISDLSDTLLRDSPCSDFMGMLSWDISVTPFKESRRWYKLFEDQILGLCFFIVSLPLMILIAIGIKLTSPGPVLFKQKRHGVNGNIINVYKFRTMHVHQETDGTLTQATRNDRRCTKLGAFLRRTNLDELPQFYNVLRGDMSIVGPRPHAVVHNLQYAELVDEYMRRHKVKPGITGWAQVNGWRGETDTIDKMKYRVQYDLYYIRNWSLWLDLKIIALTMLRFFGDKYAY